MSVDKTNTIKNISVDELKQILDKKEITLYDVRTPDEFGERHIKQAENKPLDTLADFEPEQKKTYVICKAGGRSSKAAKILSEKGVPVVNVEGGMDAWDGQTVSDN